MKNTFRKPLKPNLPTRLQSLNEMVELENEHDCASIWFEPRTNNFCLMLNAKVIKATKTFNPIAKKISELRLREVKNA